MQLTPSSCTRVLALLAVLLLLSINAVAPQQCNLKCSDKMNHSATSLYAMKLHENYYSPLNNLNIDVKVYRTKCPDLNTPGPSWFKVEAFVENTKHTIGEFETFKDTENSEAYTIKDNTAIEFSTWDAVSIYDLPRTYQWKKEAGNNGTICFRLTVLVDKCRQIVQCILPRTLSMNSSEEHFGSGDINLFLPNSGQELPEDEDAVLPIPEHCQNNCTNVKQGSFCSIPYDRKSYSSRCEWRVQKCALRARGVDVQPMEVINCGDRPNSTNVDYKNCWEEKREDGKWNEGCNCKGYYKSIQCRVTEKEETKCWCSNPNGSQWSPDPQIKYQCTDPKEYEYPSYLQACLPQ
ncbi:uncharacterized protein LOC135331744 [Halichondria panicea]|uniref:uncharacterized protein LOC135331744 n=1 Tax=Halichondria panicea TaxID=6063 RepID=UPI00312BB60E